MEKTYKIKIMGDYCSSGLWNLDTFGMIETEDLPIPENIKNRIETWAYDWDCFFTTFMMTEINNDYHLTRNYYHKIYRSKEFRRIEKEQLLLAKILKKYLGKKSKIYIFSDKKLFLKLPFLNILTA